MKTYIFILFLGPGLALGLGVPSAIAAKGLLTPDLLPDAPFRLLSSADVDGFSDPPDAEAGLLLGFASTGGLGGFNVELEEVDGLD